MSPAREPLLYTLVKTPQLMPPSAEDGVGRRGSTSSLPVYRRLFALEDASLTASNGDRWRTIATPIYHGWVYEVIAQTDRFGTKRLCGLYSNESALSDRVSVEDVTGSETHTLLGRSHLVFNQPLLTIGIQDPFTPVRQQPAVKLIDFFALLPVHFDSVRAYYPWEAVVLQHFALSIKNGLLAEAVRMEAGCHTQVGKGPQVKKATGSPSIALKALARKAFNALSPTQFSEDAWNSAVEPFLAALSPYLLGS